MKIKNIIILFILMLNCPFSYSQNRTPIGTFNKLDESDYSYYYCYSDFINDRNLYENQSNRLELSEVYFVDLQNVADLIRSNFKIKSCISSNTLTIAKDDKKLTFSFIGILDKNAKILSCAVTLSSRNNKNKIVLTETEVYCIISYCLNNFQFKNLKTPPNNCYRYISFVTPVQIE